MESHPQITSSCCFAHNLSLFSILQSKWGSKPQLPCIVLTLRHRMQTVYSQPFGGHPSPPCLFPMNRSVTLHDTFMQITLPRFQSPEREEFEWRLVNQANEEGSAEPPCAHQKHSGRTQQLKGWIKYTQFIYRRFTAVQRWLPVWTTLWTCAAWHISAFGDEDKS